MKKAAKVINSSDENHPTELYKLEGRVTFSESHITPGSWSNTTIKLDSDKREFWIRGHHEIPCGAKIRVFYMPGCSQLNPAVAEAYEILTNDSKRVIRRYCTQFREFF
jgi:hypothetical protein